MTVSRHKNDLLKNATRKATRLELYHKGGDSGRSPNVLSYGQLGSCVQFIEANMDFCPQESVGPAQEHTSTFI